MRVAFVDDTIRFSIPLGISWIASVLREGGHEVALFAIQGDSEGVIERIRRWEPDGVAFSVISGSHQSYYTFAHRLKERVPVPTIWGGPHPTFFPEMIELPFVDAVCVGEGEEAARLYCDRFDSQGGSPPVDTPNFWVKRNGQIHRNPVMPRNRRLDDLPFPARDLYYDQFDVLRQHGIKHFMAHRGCPYKCTYCFNHSYNDIYRQQASDRKVLSSRSPDNIVDEILWLRERVPLRMVAFVDDVFTIHRSWTMEFARVYADRCRIPFSCNTRFDLVDDEMVAALSEAGLRLVYAGVESGNEQMRNEVMLRRMTEQSMYEAAGYYKKYGVKLLTENVLGGPGETFASALDTLRVNQKIRPDLANASVFAPYPKLEMTRYAVENGYFDGDFDRLNHNYYHDSVMRFRSEKEKRRILNLRCFFSLLARHPGYYRLVRPLLDLKPNSLFRWLGDLIDGYYLKKCVAYQFAPKDFLVTLKHYLRVYRGGTSSGRTAEARKPPVAGGENVGRNRTQSPYCGG